VVCLCLVLLYDRIKKKDSENLRWISYVGTAQKLINQRGRYVFPPVLQKRQSAALSALESRIN